jgi:hypothetical protein
MSKTRVYDYETVAIHRPTKIRLERHLEHGQTFDNLVSKLLDVFEKPTGVKG